MYADETVRAGWYLARSVTAVDDALASMDLGSAPTGTVDIKAQAIGGIELICLGDGTDGQTVTVQVYVARKARHGRFQAHYVGQILFTLGTQEVSYDPETGNEESAMDLFADTATVTDKWKSTQGLHEFGDSASNRIGGAIFDAFGYDRMVCVVTAMTATAAKIYYSYLNG